MTTQTKLVGKMPKPLMLNLEPKQAHTSTPWRVDSFEGRDLQNKRTSTHCIRTADESEKIALLGENKIANAQFIVKAVNCHDELVETLKKIIFECEDSSTELYGASLGFIKLKAKQALKKAGV